MRRTKTPLSVFQAHLPFKRPVPQRTIAVSLALERRMIFILGALLFALAFVYSYFVMMSVAHVVAREDTQYDTERLSGAVAELEQQYLAASVQITEAKALASGFTLSPKQTFVERDAVTLRDAR